MHLKYHKTQRKKYINYKKIQKWLDNKYSEIDMDLNKGLKWEYTKMKIERGN